MGKIEVISPRSYPKLDTSNDQKNYFLSGPLVSADKIISLDPGIELIDRFKIEDHLGNGRYGSVFVAEDMLRLMKVALKVVKANPSAEHGHRIAQYNLDLCYHHGEGAPTDKREPVKWFSRRLNKESLLHKKI